ncbi:MAG: dihydrodipicolinate synthase family protein [Phycisphaerales bacterium]|nr:dihydrodipicolinate synthase family protein [Phycisphaerales bacterium]
MTKADWQGVIPAITTPFDADLSIDHAFLAKHAAWMIDAGCTGIVSPGSLGEGATLTHAEKLAIFKTLHGSVGSRAPIIAAISALSTAEAVQTARDAKAAGCRGLMVLPPYVYRGEWRETKAHFAAILRATDLSCMLYNNPLAYGTDVSPEQIAELAGEFPNLHAVKESSADVRRLTGIRAIIGDRLALLVGVDDLICEGIAAGATGWIAGLVNAYPKESVELFNLSRKAHQTGEWSKAFTLYRWFLPLLRLDVVPEFVHLIKLVQQEVGMGSERVRPPRLELAGAKREAALKTIREGIKTRPAA